MTEETKECARSYPTRGTEKKLMSDAMTTSKTKHILKQRQRNTIAMEEEIPEDQIVSVEKEKEVS